MESQNNPMGRVLLSLLFSMGSCEEVVDLTGVTPAVCSTSWI